MREREGEQENRKCNPKKEFRIAEFAVSVAISAANVVDDTNPADAGAGRDLCSSRSSAAASKDEGANDHHRNGA